MTEELKPCPFCGGKAIMNTTEFSGSMRQVQCTKCDAHTLWAENPVRLWNNRPKKQKIQLCPFCGGKAKLYTTHTGQSIVQCNKCANFSGVYETSECAIEAWNRRI